MRSLGSKAEMGVLAVGTGISVIVMGVCLALWGRLGAVERAVAAGDESAIEKEISRRIESLSDRLETTREDLRSQRAFVSGMVKSLSGLASEVATAKRALEAAPSAAQVSGLVASMNSLRDDLAQVKRLAEEAAKEPRAAAPAAGASALDVAALAGRLNELDATVAELGRKVSALKTPQVRVDEAALRAAVSQVVQEEVKKALEQQRETWRRRREQQ